MMIAVDVTGSEGKTVYATTRQGETDAMAVGDNSAVDRPRLGRPRLLGRRTRHAGSWSDADLGSAPPF